MQSQLESERSILRNSIISIDRPDSSQLVDLHVYIIPKNVWRDRQNLAENEVIEQAISAGFVHVPQNLTIQDLRQHILNICGQDTEFPKEFIYLRSVGRCLTKVRAQQETDLRVKNYRPPTTFAPEIFVLEGHHDEDPSTRSNSKSYLFRESPIHPQPVTSGSQSTTSRPGSWMKTRGLSQPPPLSTHSPLVHSNDRQNSTNFHGLSNASFSNFSKSSSTLSARDLAKLREEQERLRLRQIELARQRREFEQEQEKRAKELAQNQRAVSREQRQREEEAALKIQAAYRGYRYRRKTKREQQQRQISNFVEYRGLWSPDIDVHEIQALSIKYRNIYSTPLEKYRIWRNEHQWSASSSIKNETIQTKKSDTAQSSFGFSYFRHAAHEIERLQKEARELTRRKAEKEHAEKVQAHEIARLTDRLQELKTQRTELETTREETIRRMQQLHAQIAVRRKEEREIWKQKYLVSKKKTAALEERNKKVAVPKDDQQEPDPKIQVIQTKIRLKHATKLRKQAENECQLLKQELQELRANLNALQKQPPVSQQQQQSTIPISLDITLQY